MKRKSTRPGAKSAKVQQRKATPVRHAAQQDPLRVEDPTDLIQDAPVGFQAVDASGKILRANAQAISLLGFPEHECVGHDIRAFHVTPILVDDILRRLLNREVLRSIPAELRAKDGSVKDVLIDASALWRNGKFLHARVFTRDVSEILRTRAQVDRLAGIVESSDDAILSKTLQGIITSCNKGAEKIFGYSAAEVIGKSITMFIPPELLMEEKDILARVARGEHVDHYETIRRRKDGRLIDVSLTISPLRDSLGRVVGASKVARDISDRKQAHRALQKINEELEDRVTIRTQSLEEAVRELDTFSHTAAHDLRSPLRAVCRFSQLLQEGFSSKLDETGRKFLEEVVSGTKRMDSLVTDLLSYARMSREELPIQDISLDEVMDSVEDNLKEELKDRKAELKIRRPLPRVQGNVLSLTQALSNLILNAAKFSGT